MFTNHTMNAGELQFCFCFDRKSYEPFVVFIFMFSVRFIKWIVWLLQDKKIGNGISTLTTKCSIVLLILVAVQKDEPGRTCCQRFIVWSWWPEVQNKGSYNLQAFCDFYSNPPTSDLFSNTKHWEKLKFWIFNSIVKDVSEYSLVIIW